MKGKTKVLTPSMPPTGVELRRQRISTPPLLTSLSEYLSRNRIRSELFLAAGDQYKQFAKLILADR